MITDLQKTRIRFHLGYSSAGIGQFFDRLTVDGLSTSAQLMLVGTTLDYEFLETPLCQVGSLLYKCEVAYANLDPGVIDDSLGVSAVNTIRLRGNELAKRKEIYHYQCERLAQATNSPLIGGNASGRRGYVR